MSEVEEVEYETVSKTTTRYECDIGHCTERVDDKSELFTVTITGPDGNLNEEKHICSNCVVDENTYKIVEERKSIQKWVDITVNSVVVFVFTVLLFLFTVIAYLTAGYIASIAGVVWVLGGIVHLAMSYLIAVLTYDIFKENF